MHRINKLDVAKVFKLRALGLSNAIIAQRLGVTQGAIYHILRKHDAEHGAAENTRPLRRSPCWM